jgi:hypothetical protein
MNASVVYHSSFFTEFLLPRVGRRSSPNRQNRPNIFDLTRDRIRYRLTPKDFMRHTRLIATTCISTGAAVLLAFGIAGLQAQRRGGGQTAQALFAALDTHKAGTLTRPELESGFNS